jgi:oxygen-independent coproporphyrinogen-3 oxidase
MEADMYEWICMSCHPMAFISMRSPILPKGPHESMHNKAYWNYRDFYGISMGASGKQGLVRYDHTVV